MAVKKMLFLCLRVMAGVSLDRWSVTKDKQSTASGIRTASFSAALPLQRTMPSGANEFI